jgi:hypothetical protein
MLAASSSTVVFVTFCLLQQLLIANIIQLHFICGCLTAISFVLVPKRRKQIVCATSVLN